MVGASPTVPLLRRESAKHSRDDARAVDSRASRRLQMAQIDEVGPDIFRISIFVPDFQLGFNEFLVRDREPLLFHTGMQWMFPEIREAVATLIDPATLRWIGFSH